MSKGDFSGIIPALATPYNENLDVDYEGYIEHCQWLLACGCDGLLSMGTTGEAPSLSFKERIKIIESFEKNNLTSKTIFGIATANYSESAELARYAYDAGAKGVLALPSFFFRDASQDGIFDYYANLIEKIADKQLPLMIYDFPKMSGQIIEVNTIKRLMREFPDIICGIKNSSGNWVSINEQLTELKDLDIFVGKETNFDNMLQAGAAGCISASFNLGNYFLPTALKIYRDHGTSIANHLQNGLNGLRSVIDNSSGLLLVKAILANGSKNANWAIVRPPLISLDEELAEKAISELKEILADIDEIDDID